MRIRIWLLALMSMTMLLASCGSTAQAPVAVVQSDPSPTSTQAPPTALPTATIAPASVPTATTASTAEVTATAAPVVADAIPAATEDVSDTAHLPAEAAPELVAQTSAVQPAQPVRIRIPAINLDYKPVSVGLNKQRVPIVPKHDVGWYNLSAMPGQGENIVFWGHVLRFKNAPKIPAPFARIKEVKPGAQIILTTAKGEVARYKVTQTLQVTPDQVKYILPVGKEQVTLVSCIGDNVVTNGEFTKKYRLVTIAEPIK